MRENAGGLQKQKVTLVDSRQGHEAQNHNSSELNSAKSLPEPLGKSSACLTPGLWLCEPLTREAS